jgi:hypothetical protein
LHAGCTTIPANADVLYEIAASQRLPIPLEGTAWRSLPIALSARWRHALPAPRVIVPHPNRGNGAPITPTEAAALVVSGRFFDFDRFVQQHPDDVPALKDLSAHPEWPWRFVGHLASFVRGEQIDPLPLIDSADPMQLNSIGADVIRGFDRYQRPRRADCPQ